MKIIITGASGFIGTNLLEYYKNNQCEVFNFDIEEPRNKGHFKYWKKVDICNFDALRKSFEEIQPDYIIHLAAKTDLNEKDGIEYYKANIQGVENVVKLCSKGRNIKRVIFTSSMLVNDVGYKPRNIFDYNPHTLYGKSKVIGENIVFKNKENLTEFCIIRPTSIWGEWFAEPYKDFFDFVLSGNFFHPGDKACIKTYGYVGNTIYQINKILFADVDKIHGQVFYLGDHPPLNISHFANEIADAFGVKRPQKIPFLIFKLSGWFGDILTFFGFKFPVTSFRVRNMTTNNIVNLENTYELIHTTPFNFKEALKKTLIWFSKNS